MTALVARTDRDGVTQLLLNRPEQRNALSTGLLVELREQLRSVRDDPAVRVVVLGGAGESFCAGADLGEFPDGGVRRAEPRAATAGERGARAADGPRAADARHGERVRGRRRVGPGAGVRPVLRLGRRRLRAPRGRQGLPAARSPRGPARAGGGTGARRADHVRRGHLSDDGRGRRRLGQPRARHRTRARRGVVGLRHASCVAATTFVGSRHDAAAASAAGRGWPRPRSSPGPRRCSDPDL